VTVATAGIGKVTVQGSYNGKVLVATIEIKKHLGNPPANNSTSAFYDVTSTSDNTITDELSVVVPADGQLDFVANLTFRTGSPNGSSNIKGKARYATSSGGTFSDVGGFVTGTAETAPFASKYGSTPGADGSLTINQTLTGLTPGATIYFKIVAQSTGAPSLGYPIHVFGSFSGS
jgi:hypothetical protein